MNHFCDYAPVFRLACNNNRLQWFVVAPLLWRQWFIILSYVSILVTIFKMESINSGHLYRDLDAGCHILHFCYFLY